MSDGKHGNRDGKRYGKCHMRCHDSKMAPAQPNPSKQLTSGLWLLVVETLILNIISQRARPMMIENSGEQA